jgi:hypothetical protein
MANTQVLIGAIAALLLVIVVLLTNGFAVQHHTVGDSLHEAVQEIKR